MKPKTLTSVALVILLFAVFPYLQKDRLVSAPPTLVKDTLSTSQLSYFARIGTGTTQNDTLIKVDLTGNNPSKNSNNLFPDDVICIANSGGGCNQYTVKDIGNTAYFETSTALNIANAVSGSYIIATRSAVHTVNFTPQSNVTGGRWQFLIKASSRSGENAADGMPDQQGFDIGSDVGSTTTGIGTRLKVADISCPWGATASIGVTAATVKDAGGNDAFYHTITCTLGAGATNPVGVGATITIGRPLASGSQIINPSTTDASVATHTEGNADLYTYFIRHLDSNGIVIDADTAAGKLAMVESVRVTAIVDPSITFTIDNIGTTTPGATRCGVPLTAAAANTTATTVNFGSLLVGQANDTAQRINVITNGNSYIVQAYKTDFLKSIGDGTTIPDNNCDGSCSAAVPGGSNWGLNTNSKFGFSMEAIGVGYTISTNSPTANFVSKAFGTVSAPVTMMQRASTPTTTDSAYVCYRISVSTAQKAGIYETNLVYLATATF